MKMKWLALALVLCPCGLALGGEIADLHAKQAATSNPDQSRTHEEVDDELHGVSEIGLERPRWYARGSVYTVVIRSDGTFRYTGEADVPHLGRHSGRVTDAGFRRLAQFIKDSGYADLQDTYARPVTDHPTAYTTVVLNGKRKVVKNYANAGPTKLWAIEQLIDKLLLEATWDADADGQK